MGCNCFTQFKWTYHESCPGGILWVPEDEKSADQQEDTEDADNRYAPRFRLGQGI